MDTISFVRVDFREKSATSCLLRLVSATRHPDEARSGGDPSRLGRHRDHGDGLVVSRIDTPDAAVHALGEELA